mgnify:CR=1 FL=1
MQNKTEAGSLVVCGLSKQYRLHNMKHVLAVKDLTFAVSPGEVCRSPIMTDSSVFDWVV